MSKLYWPSKLGFWWIDTEDMIWPGGKPLDLEKLWAPAPLEFANHPHPDVDGDLPRDPYEVGAQHDIHYHLNGLCLPDGTSTEGDLAAGFEANYDELIRKVGTRSTWGDSTIGSTVQMPSGAERVADIQAFVHPPGSERGTVMAAAVTVVIPRGKFEPAGS